MTALPPKRTHNFFPLRFSPPISVSPAERRSMIEIAAYYRAELRQFAAGHEIEDWTAAELEVDSRISQALRLVGIMVP